MEEGLLKMKVNFVLVYIKLCWEEHAEKGRWKRVGGRGLVDAKDFFYCTSIFFHNTPSMHSGVSLAPTELR